MKIVFFTRSKDSAISIGKAFAVLIDEISKSQQVKSYYVPYASYSLYKMWRNILYVYRNRTKTGINHITGEIHFCMFALIGVKSVLTVHDLGFYTNKPMSKIKKAYLYLFQLYFPFCLADKIVAISDFTRDEIIRLVPSVANKVVRANHHSVDEYIYTWLLYTSPSPRD